MASLASVVARDLRPFTAEAASDAAAPTAYTDILAFTREAAIALAAADAAAASAYGVEAPLRRAGCARVCMCALGGVVVAVMGGAVAGCTAVLNCAFARCSSR